MEVNKNYYPDFAYKRGLGSWTTGTPADNADFICSNALSTYGFNQTLDTSITYACSTSNYASLTTATTYGARYRSQSAPYIEAETKTFPNVTNRNYQGAYLCRVVGNLTDAVSSRQNIYINGGFSPAGESSNKYSSVFPITGFKYYSVVLVPIIGYCAIDDSGSNEIRYADLERWRDIDKSKYGICGLFFGVTSGSATGRSPSDIVLADAVPLNVGSVVHTDDGYKINETQTILNYFPCYRTGGDFPYKMWHAGVTIYPNENYMRENPLFEGSSSICKMVDSSFVQKDADMWGGSFKCKYNLFNLSEEDILHMGATYGLIFSTSFSNACNINLLTDEGITNNDIYFPVMTGNLWQGAYVHGQDNKNTQQYKEDWNSDINAPFNKGSAVPGGDLPVYGDDSLTANSGNTSALTHRYLLNNAKMQTISTYLNNVDEHLLTAIVNNIKMSGDNPINSVVSIQYVPFDISTYAPAVSDVIIGSNLVNIGTSESPVALSANVITADSIVIELGECTITPKNKNFLDYEPYTKYVCYIPFCNFIELDAGIVTNKKLSFSLVCDLVGGTCEGVIRVNGRIYKTIDGVFSTQCSVQGVDSASYINSLLSTTGKYVGGLGAMVGAVAGIATGGISTAVATAGILAGAGTVASSLYEFNTTPKEFTSVGKSVGLIGQRLPQHVCIYKYFCEDITDENFKNFAGYACNFVATLNTLTGFTKCGNVQLNGFNATSQEKEEIKMLLETGVII